uniref:Uncharacterized protein n=1 Tax=Rhizophora mucronata TaxID=61149 RepID=A0A2P2Q9D8_RHIMU
MLESFMGDTLVCGQCALKCHAVKIQNCLFFQNFSKTAFQVVSGCALYY